MLLRAPPQRSDPLLVRTTSSSKSGIFWRKPRGTVPSTTWFLGSSPLEDVRSARIPGRCTNGSQTSQQTSLSKDGSLSLLTPIPHRVLLLHAPHKRSGGLLFFNKSVQSKQDASSRIVVPDELDLYLSLPQAPYEDTNVLDWWRDHAPQLPNLG